MNNNTLIAGFEDIMTHIKNQEIRIKKLTAAKEEADKLYYTEYNGKTYEPWELKEENKKLHNIIDSTNADYEKLVDKNNNDNLNFADILSERDDEIKKLNDQYDNLQAENDHLLGHHLELKKENEKLKKECRDLRQWHLSDDMINDISAENIDEFERDVRDNWDELNGVGSFSGPPTSQVLEKKIVDQERELQELRTLPASIEILEACNGMQKVRIKELEEETTPLTAGPVSILQEKNDKLTKELVTAHEYLRQFSAAGKEAVRMTKDIIMNLMIKIIKELCDEESVDIEKEWQADTRGVKWTDKDYNDFMINICKEMDDDNWNDFGGITLEWKDDTLYFRRVEP